MDTSELSSTVEYPLPPFGKAYEHRSKSRDCGPGLKLEPAIDSMPPTNIHDYILVTSESSQITSIDTYPLLSTLERPKMLGSKTHDLIDTRYSKHKKNVHYCQVKTFYCDPSHFKSVVKHLTGTNGEDMETYRFKLEKEIRVSKASDDMLRCVRSLKMLEDTVNVSQECLNCLVYCSLFPKNYEIDRDTLIQLWMAEGLIMEEPMEDTAASYIRALCNHGEYVSFLREDYGTGKLWYKLTVSDLPERVLKSSKITPVKGLSDDPTKTNDSHVTLQDILTKDFQTLGRFTKLSSLLLSRKHRSNILNVPFDLFMSMKNLRALDLSRTKVSELPSSIGNAICLRFLDLSETFIRRLPETIEFLQNLQTLKLQNCPRLIALPKATRRLTSLRHLETGTRHNISYMPVGMRELTCLRTLSEFIVGRKFGCQIGELQKMNKLGGKLRLSKLENVASLDDAKKVNLSHKLLLKKLELRWTDEDVHPESIGANHKVIEYLQPHTNLEDLRILCYGGSAFPSWLSHPSLLKLTRITLFKCANCLFLPSLGQLPSLESLSLIELTRVRNVSFQFRREETIATDDDNNDQLVASPAVVDDGQFVAFPALQQLQIKSLPNLEKWSDVEKHDFPCLKNLSIKDCPKLAALCELTYMNSLESLELNLCTKLSSLQDGELPASLKTLVIDRCPSLTLNPSIVGQQEWIKIQHCSSLLIYQRKDEEEFCYPPQTPQQTESPTASSEVMASAYQDFI